MFSKRYAIQQETRKAKEKRRRKTTAEEKHKYRPRRYSTTTCRPIWISSQKSPRLLAPSLSNMRTIPSQLGTSGRIYLLFLFSCFRHSCVVVWCRFQEILQQIEEVEGGAVKVNDKDSRSQVLSQLAATELSFPSTLPSKATSSTSPTPTSLQSPSPSSV